MSSSEVPFVTMRPLTGVRQGIACRRGNGRFLLLFVVFADGLHAEGRNSRERRATDLRGASFIQRERLRIWKVLLAYTIVQKSDPFFMKVNFTGQQLREALIMYFINARRTAMEGQDGERWKVGRGSKW